MRMGIGGLSTAALLGFLAMAAFAAPPTSQPAPATTRPALSPADRAALMAEFKAAYGLQPGQNVRLIFPPFPPVRSKISAARRQPSSRFFIYFDNGRMGGGVVFGNITLNDIIHTELYIPWWNVENLDDVHWPAGDVDVTFRLSASIQQRLEGMLDYIQQRTGDSFQLLQRKETRPCIVVHGRNTHPAFTDASNHQTVLVLTQTPWTPQVQALYDNAQEHPYPVGTVTTILTPDVPQTERLDAPFFDEHRLYRPPGRVLIAPDAKLDHHDPQYAEQLQHVVDNVNKQIGGDWRVEPREITIYRFEAEGL